MPQSATWTMRLAGFVIRRAHVVTSHQAVAFEAIALLSAPGGLRWQRVFLRDGGRLALGAAAPDAEFRDFKNHAQSGDSRSEGGAAERAQAWSQNLTQALHTRDWQCAAYCAGVLCHYVVDALLPPHAGPSAVEVAAQAAFDASAWQRFPEMAGQDRAVSAVVLGTGRDAVARAVADGAGAARTRFDIRATHVDRKQSAVRAADGPDAARRAVMAEASVRAMWLVAAIMDRAITESAAAGPDASLTLAGGAALVRWPWTAVQRWRQGRASPAVIGATPPSAEAGHSERDLSVIAADSGPRPGVSGNVVAFEPKRAAAVHVEDGEAGAEIVDLSRQRRPIEPARPAPRLVLTEPVRQRAEVMRQLAVADVDDVLAVPAAAIAVAARLGDAAGIGHAVAAALAPSLGGGVSNFRDRRAAVAGDAGAVVPMSADALAAWQVAIPGVSSAQAQLLDGAGYPSAAAIAASDVEKFCADILAFAMTEQGRQLLRDAPPPDIEAVRGWLEAARAAKAA